VILRFPYLEESFQGSAPPSLPSSAHGRWRPLIPITVYGPAGASLSFGRTLLDTGADDTIFPLDVATQLAILLLPSSAHAMRWRGQRYPLRFGAMELALVDDVGTTVRWTATVAFSAAAMRYPLLGVAGCLQYFDAKFLGKDRVIELEPNDLLPATVRP
jgi:hypothetical protein